MALFFGKNNLCDVFSICMSKLTSIHQFLMTEQVVVLLTEHRCRMSLLTVEINPLFNLHNGLSEILSILVPQTNGDVKHINESNAA